jgi:hypothetical protein
MIICFSTVCWSGSFTETPQKSYSIPYKDSYYNNKKVTKDRNFKPSDKSRQNFNGKLENWGKFLLLQSIPQNPINVVIDDFIAPLTPRIVICTRKELIFWVVWDMLWENYDNKKQQKQLFEWSVGNYWGQLFQGR